MPTAVHVASCTMNEKISEYYMYMYMYMYVHVCTGIKQTITWMTIAANTIKINKSLQSVHMEGKYI